MIKCPYLLTNVSNIKGDGQYMINENLLDIVKVQETHSQNEVNDLLSQGWKLLNVYTGSFSYDASDQINMYVLGKPNDR